MKKIIEMFVNLLKRLKLKLKSLYASYLSLKKIPVVAATEPFDLVITWVDWSNKFFVEQMMEAGGRSEGCETGDFIELKYLLRSIEQLDIGYRHIHIVHSDNHPPPKYLRETNKLSFVPHSKIVRDSSYLPLIHRESILIHLHRIPNLANNFFYIEDDLLILDKRIFFNYFYNLEQKQIPVFRRKIGLNYDVTKVEGLWLQSTINTHRHILGSLFNKENYGSAISLEHSMHFFNKSILQEIEEKYKTQFLATASYQNQHKEKAKEKDLICIVAIYYGYLIHHLKYKELKHPYNFVSIIHTNGITNDADKKITYFKEQLKQIKYYQSVNLQGNGISDEYPPCESVNNIYMDWLNKTYPTPTEFEK